MSALGSLEIHPIADDEYDLFVPPLFGTMGMAGFVAGLYPNNNTKEGLQSAEERFKIEKAANAGIRWIKAVDAAGKIVGVAQYAVLEDPTKHYANCFEVAPETTWPEPSDKEYAEELWESYIRPRREVLATEKYPVVCLQILCVWPEHQKQGVGKKLTGWGCELADRLNAVCTVESSSAAQPLYEKFGYELKEAFPCEVSERFQHRLGPGGVRFMVRRRKVAA